MGGTVFFAESSGDSPANAFISAVRHAAWEGGHGGYTGTVAEKQDYTVINLPDGKDAYTFANQLIENDDPRIRDKWGAAGCIDITDTSRGHESKLAGASSGKRVYLFFGWASS